MKSSGIFIFIFLTISMIGCKPAEVLLHGDITGVVTDAETSQPIQSALVDVINTDDTTRTVSDGTFLLRNIIPGKYEIQTSKTGYDLNKKNVTVAPAVTQQIDFPLKGIPVPHYSSKCLDFGLDSTNLTVTISNLGKGVFTYVITESQPWISVSPSSGEVSTEPENIRITINKIGLSDNIYNGLIEITSTGQGVLIKDTVHVNLNGVADKECNYYKVVKIGSQTWMAENLNIGRVIDIHQEPSDNGYVEKWCSDCKTYGGLYTWKEAMNYGLSDTAEIGTSQGICPVGWHIPTDKEVTSLSAYLGGNEKAGGKLKSTGTSLWQTPNSGATNESGFTALPGGNVSIENPDLGLEDPFYNYIDGIGTDASFWTSSYYPNWIFHIATPSPINAGGDFGVGYSTTDFGVGNAPAKNGNSIRCVKNPGKK
jgi:uncharacterized protein (TIGR02145 family)